LDNIKTKLKLLCFFPLYLLIVSCSTAVVHTPTKITAVTVDQQDLKTLTKDVEVKFDTGYARSLKAGSQWRRIGVVAQGDVYKPYNDVFTVEGAHVHEAYLVVASNMLAGFYLPYEGGFSPLKQNVSITFE